MSIAGIQLKARGLNGKASATSKKKSCDFYPGISKTAIVPGSNTQHDFENTRTNFGTGTRMSFEYDVCGIREGLQQIRWGRYHNRSQKPMSLPNVSIGSPERAVWIPA